jgi:2-C-methyl-D-erythritol 4-phosphate cytidylyltransferase
MPQTRLQEVTILIPAAGLGQRLGLGPKALLELNQVPLISWVTQKALLLSDDVVVAVPPGYLAIFRQLCPQCRLIEGGKTRQESVIRLGLAAERKWVVIMDVARPFFSTNLLDVVWAAAQETGAAGAFLIPDVPVALLAGDRMVRDFRPGEVGLFQTPQVLLRTLLQSVHEEASRRQWQEQSTLQLFLRAGHAVRAVPGERTNIKVTTPDDWRLAQLLTDYLQ